jgi:galactokinase
MNIREKVLEAFQSAYRTKPQFLIRAPGRANLIGEHTDYNDGFVMPLAVDRAVWLAVGTRSDHRISVQSLDFGGQPTTFATNQLEDRNLPHWSKHVRGAWWYMQQEGKTLPGANVVIGGDIPIGAGMSSSAAIGVGVIETVLAILGDKSHTQKQKALMAVEIEHEFMGVPCGVMDQMASAAALDHSAMLLDCRSLEISPVPLPASVRVVVINSMKKRELADSAYAERRAQCQSAAQRVGVAALRDADLALLEEKRDKLGDTLYRRARHVVTENARTLEMKSTLEKGDLQKAGELLNASHASLRDDYEVSIRELDVLSSLAQAQAGCYGARIMGGGFGGCAVALVKTEAVEAFTAGVKLRYLEATQLDPEFYVCIPAAGSSAEVF